MNDPSSNNPTANIRRYFVLCAEIVGILTILAAVYSIAINSLLFGEWGLSFVSLASTGDILLSGFGQADVAVGTLVAVGLGYWMTAIVPEIGTSPLQNSNVVFVFLVTAAGSATYITALLRGSMPTVLYYIPMIALGSALFLSVRNWPSGVVGPSRGSRIRFLALALLIVLGFGLFGLGTLIRERARLASLTGLYVVSEQDNCPEPRVLWVGVESVVAVCTNAREANYIILPRSTVTLGKIARPPR